MTWLKEIWQDFSHLMFPYNCAACEYALSGEEHIICNFCLQNLPQTMYWTYEDNMVASTFYGRLRFVRACSFLYFTKGEKVQNMLHQLKYAQQPEVGRVLGDLFGQKLAVSPYSEVDCIVPVPLHSKRLKTRGYNQCDHIVQGMAEAMEKQYLTSAIKRIRANETQTKKGRYDRWINVYELFSVVEPQRLAHKHVLLVDDVVTTGATLEACAKAILAVPGTTVSIATIASPSVI
jgi:ComF family protein